MIAATFAVVGAAALAIFRFSGWALGEPEPGALAVDVLGLRFRWIPGGAYSGVLGPLEPPHCSKAGKSPREVVLKGFWLAETETTQAFWLRHIPANLSEFADCGDCPVDDVSFFDGVGLANLLSEKAGLEPCYELNCYSTLGEWSYFCRETELKPGCLGYRLPTVAELEVATRAQAAGSSYKARYGKRDEIQWHSGNSGAKTHPVGLKAANAWGLHDLLGNVWEWTGDPYNPLVPPRILHGGSWQDDGRALVAGCNMSLVPPMRQSFVGLRLAVGRVVADPRLAR